MDIVFNQESFVEVDNFLEELVKFLLDNLIHFSSAAFILSAVDEKMRIVKEEMSW